MNSTTTIQTLKPPYSGRIALKINGRTCHYSRIESVTPLGSGRFDVVRQGIKYHVEGGKSAGGSRRDWFLDGLGDKAIICTSLLDALNLLENM